MIAAADQADRYAVVGNPIAHSLSPQIHQQFALQSGQSLRYDAIEIERDAFAARVAELAAAGFRGINVTVPFKREAWELCTQRSPRAELAGAVNTISFLADGGLAGDTTDGVGLTRDLESNLRIPLRGRELLLLGAGGAVRGVLEPILAQAPARLVISNRTLAKAQALAEDFAALGRIEVRAYPDLGDSVFDLVINGTAAGLDGAVPPLPAGVLGEHSACYDMMYNRAAPTAFVAWALAHGAAAAHDGLGMLVEQAAEAFLIWRGLRPETAGVIRSLRAT